MKLNEAKQILNKNGYLLEDDLSNLDIEKVFNEVPKVSGYKEKLSPEWQKVLRGEL